MTDDGRSPEQQAELRKVWILLAVLSIGSVLLTLLFDQSNRDENWTWNPIHEPLALLLYILWPSLIALLVYTGRKASRASTDASVKGAAKAGNLEWYADKYQLRSAFVFKAISAADFDPTYRYQAWDQIPAEVFLTHVRRFEEDGWLTHSARTVHRITSTAFIAILVLFFSAAISTLDGFIITVGVTLSAVAAYAAWLGKQNLRVARDVDAITHLGKVLNESPAPYPLTPEVKALARKANLYWLSFPLSVLALVPIGLVVRIFATEPVALWVALLFAPILISKIGGQKMQQQLTACKLPD